MSNSGKGYTLVIASAFLTGCIYTLGKVALGEITPALLVAWIFSIASITLAFWTAATGRLRDILKCTARDWVIIFFFSAFSIAALLTMWTGIQGLDPTVAAFISRLQTLVTVFLGVFFLKERFRALEGLGGLLLIVGVVIIRISFDVTLSYWFWVMVISGVLFGITEIFAKQAVRSLHPIPLNFVRNSIIAIFFVVWILAKKQPLFALGNVWPQIVAMGIAGPLFSRLSFLYAMRYIDVSKAVLVNQMQPIFVALVAFAFLGAIPTLREWVGGLIILTGCVIMITGHDRVRGWIREGAA